MSLERPGDSPADAPPFDAGAGVGAPLGTEHAARHLQLGERVAIKVLVAEAGARDGAASRFLQQARATVRIRSEHVVRVLDVGEERRAPQRPVHPPAPHLTEGIRLARTERAARGAPTSAPSPTTPSGFSPSRDE